MGLHQEFLLHKLYQQMLSTRIWFVHHLNNRGCLLVMEGNFTEANLLFEDALKCHEKIASEMMSSSYDRSTGTSPNFSSSTHGLAHSEEHQRLRTNVNWINAAGIEDDDDEDADVDMSLDENVGYNDTIQRMTTHSQLHTLSFCGQKVEQQEHDDDSDDCCYHHQVYKLPIVMDAIEWETASIQERSFVLVFNSALCNHLCGMGLLLQQQQQQLQGITDEAQELMVMSRRSFHVAKTLYRLATGTLENMPLFVNGVEKLCYLALFNNMSHVCKTIEGYNSHEAFCYDKRLLQAIYWLRYSNSQSSSSSSSTSSSTSSTTTSRTSNTHQGYFEQNIGITNNNSNTDASNVDDSTNFYNDDDSDIIEVFLDNVFYLIGVPDSVVPASAA